MVVDYPPESGQAAEIVYTLTEDSGERHELLIDHATGKAFNTGAIITALVGDDPDIYAHLLSTERLKNFHLEPLTRNLSKKDVWNVVKPVMAKEKTIGVRLACGLVGEKEGRFSSGKRSLGLLYFQRWE